MPTPIVTPESTSIHEASDSGISSLNVTSLSKDLREAKKLDHRIYLQRTLTLFVCRTLGFTCLAAIGIFYCQGFHVGGFHLDAKLMNWIGGVTLGTIASLAATIVTALFKHI